MVIYKSNDTAQIINMDTGALNLGGNGQAQLQIVSSNAQAQPGINVLGILLDSEILQLVRPAAAPVNYILIPQTVV